MSKRTSRSGPDDAFDTEGRRRLGRDLLDFADTGASAVDQSGSAGADPMPGVMNRVRRRRRRRVAVATSGVALAAAAATVAASSIAPLLWIGDDPVVVPAGGGATDTEEGDSKDGGSESNTGDDRGPIFSDDQPTAAEYAMFIDGDQGEAYYNDGLLTYRKDGTGQPCVSWGAAVPGDRHGGDPAEPVNEGDVQYAGPEFCFDGFEPGEDVVYETFQPADVDMGVLYLGFARPEVVEVETVWNGEQLTRTPTFSTPTSDEVTLFKAFDDGPNGELEFVGHTSYESPNTGKISSPARSGSAVASKEGEESELQVVDSRNVRLWSHSRMALGEWFEEYRPGQRGFGYIVGKNADAAVVSYVRDERPCLTLEPDPRWRNATFCFDGFDPEEGSAGDSTSGREERITWQRVESADGEWAAVIGFTDSMLADIDRGIEFTGDPDRIAAPLINWTTHSVPTDIPKGETGVALPELAFFWSGPFPANQDIGEPRPVD